MKYAITIIMLIFALSVVACSKKKENLPMPSEPEIPKRTCERMTQDYFNGFMDSSNGFIGIMIVYSNISGESPDKSPSDLLMISFKSGRYDPSDKTSTYENKNLSEITSFNAYRSHLTPPSTHDSYRCELPPETIKLILDMIREKGDYYFNGDEYKGKDSVEIEVDNDFGYDRYFALHIRKPNQVPGEKYITKTVYKGWGAGKEPPEELKPMIEYIEGTIFPAMLLYKQDR